MILLELSITFSMWVSSQNGSIMGFDNYKIQRKAVPQVMPKLETFNIIHFLCILTVHETKQCKAKRS